MLQGEIMNRRQFLGGVAAVSAGVALGTNRLAAEPQKPDRPLRVALGPQLFLDDFLIDRLDGLVRTVEAPTRLDKPVLDSKTFGTTQPYLSVVRDAEGKRYRLWYNHGPAVWHAVSPDGILWAEPKVVWDVTRGYGCSLVEDGDRERDPQRRFKIANWQAGRGQVGKLGKDTGIHVAFSSDGLKWTPHDRNPVLPTWPEGPGKPTAQGVGDIVDVYWDPLNRRYGAAVKLMALNEDGFAPAPRAGDGYRRLVGLATSPDFVRWEKPRRIFVPDDKDEGLLEFYGMGAMHVRGDQHIGLVRVLRDDLPCDEGGPKDGVGYTVLATSRDGLDWQRFREPFLPRNPQPGSWDHAMAWASGVLAVGDELFVYYGGYARGHKIAADRERQLGLARLKRDRYAALAPAGKEGRLLTRPLSWPEAGRLTVNARCGKGGAVSVRILDAQARPLADGGEAEPVGGDVLAGEVRWPKGLAGLAGQVVRLQFVLRDALLFAWECHKA
jgi:hypothetical protein